MNMNYGVTVSVIFYKVINIGLYHFGMFVFYVRLDPKI
jgi:hypothetical protein